MNRGLIVSAASSSVLNINTDIGDMLALLSGQPRPLAAEHHLRIKSQLPTEDLHFANIPARRRSSNASIRLFSPALTQMGKDNETNGNIYSQPPQLSLL